MEILNKIKEYLLQNKIQFDTKDQDGRINSVKNEHQIINKICENKEFYDMIIVPPKRMWYDMLIKTDAVEIPVNIKVTTTHTYDNVGNFAVLAYAYTSSDMSFDKLYKNGAMSKTFIQSIKDKLFNENPLRDYYFLVFGKCEDTYDKIIVNSMRCLCDFKINPHNFPMQIRWDKNSIPQINNVKSIVSTYVDKMKKIKQTWQENLICEMKML